MAILGNRQILAALAIFAAVSLPASADAVRYSYFGADASTYTATSVTFPGGYTNPGYVPPDYRITGWVELHSPLAANLSNADISNSLSSWSATVVPIPGAVWLFASALGLMG